MEGIKVTYIYHSSFLVETDRSYLLFDYWKGKIPPLCPEKTLYVFCSHAHHDHYSRDIFGLEGLCRQTYYILSKDIKKSSSFYKGASNVHFVKARDRVEIDGCRLEAFESTDEGVAFLLSVDGWTLYHAGDLHWWDWPGEPEEENALMKERYCAEIDLIKRTNMDLAFVVLDPRQEESGGLGMDYFVENVEADYIFPMHFWEDYSYIRKYYAGSGSLFGPGQFIMPERPEQTFSLRKWIARTE